MIINQDQLRQTRQELNRLEEDLESLQREVYPLNPQRFYLMAEAYVDHIMALRSQIDEFIGVRAYEDKLPGIWMRLIGPSMQVGLASTSLLTNTIDNFRKSIRSITGVLKGEIPFRKGGLSKDIEASTDLVIIGLGAGSLRVGLGLPPERQLALYDSGGEPVIKAVDTFMEVAYWSSSPSVPQELPPSILDLRYRDYILRQVLNLAPSKKLGLERIEFSGTLVHLQKAAVLTKESRSRLYEAITKEVGAEHMEAIGTIREIDLDSKKFFLRERSDQEPPLHCEVSEDMIEEAKTALGERVKVLGTIKRDKFGKIRLLRVKALVPSAGEDS